MVSRIGLLPPLLQTYPEYEQEAKESPIRSFEECLVIAWHYSCLIQYSGIGNLWSQKWRLHWIIHGNPSQNNPKEQCIHNGCHLGHMCTWRSCCSKMWRRNFGARATFPWTTLQCSFCVIIFWEPGICLSGRQECCDNIVTKTTINQRTFTSSVWKFYWWQAPHNCLFCTSQKCQVKWNEFIFGAADKAVEMILQVHI
jgi:hypothetical protein